MCFTSVVDIKGALLIFIFITCINHRGGIFNVRRSPCHPPECFLRLCHGLMSSTSADGGSTTRRSGLVFLCAPRGALCSSVDCHACQNDPPVCNHGGEYQCFYNIQDVMLYMWQQSNAEKAQQSRAEAVWVSGQHDKAWVIRADHCVFDTVDCMAMQTQ